LTGFLRANGVEVEPIDANIEAYDRLLKRDRLSALAARLERRLERLDRRPALTHGEQLAYAALWGARGDADAAPGAIDEAVALLRGERGDEAFFDPQAYAGAVATVESALRLISAAHAPLTLSFTGYRTPFSLLTADEIEHDARPDRDPFHEYFAGDLTQRLRAAGVGLVGVSVAFPGQIQPAFSLAHTLRSTLPGVHLTVGGPAITQLLVRLTGERLARAIGPFDSAIVFEGEQALLDHVRALERGESPRGLIKGAMIEDLGSLPGPDFDGLPLGKYLSPEPVLPYDPTRGCYWGVCTFCHYGLAEVGTARYRERPVDVAMAHLRRIAARHGNRIFYFSQDSVSPRSLLGLSRAIRDEGLPWRWATDMRPERSLTPEHCDELAQGGALAMALGVESAAPRVIQLIDKGLPVETVAKAIRNLAGAGVAVEAMCFTDFPTESAREAMATIRFLHELHDDVALFICGEFDLTHGSLVAQKPQEFGIRETWQLDGDELGTGLFYDERQPAKSERDQDKIDTALAELSRRWRLARYPWAGALSTAHTLLWYERHGAAVFKELAGLADAAVPGARVRSAPARYDVGRVASQAAEREGAIWHALVRERRHVSRAAYRALADAAPVATPHPGRWRVLAGAPPSGAGRRPSNAVNSTRAD
jgi:hypothetical protein